MKTVKSEYIPLQKENTFLKTELYYHLGGWNYFTAREEPRGYYVSACPVERKHTDGCTMESFTAFSGIKQCILECARQSKRREAEAEAILHDYMPDIIDAVLRKNGLQKGGTA